VRSRARINDNGYIVGTATKVSDGTTHGILLIPEQVQRDGAPTTNNQVVVGQQMNMTNFISGGFATNAVTSYHWAIPGANNTTNDTAFYDYEPTAQNSNYTNLFTPTNYTTNNYCNYYWSSGGTNQVVSCTTIMYGQTNTVAATLNVERPVAGIATATGTTTIFSYGSTHLVVFGDATTGINGMTFTETNSVPSPFTGNFIWNQLVNTNSVVRTGLVPTSFSSFGYDGGDGNYYPYHYITGSTAVDSPQTTLYSDDATSLRQFTATMYLMWKASTNSVNGDKTVAVPIRSWQWNWNSEATNSAPSTNGTSAWTLLYGTNYPSPGLANIDATNEPTWSTNEFYNRH